MAAAASGDIAIVKALLDSGVDLNSPPTNYFTPLSLATLFGHRPLTELLLARGADPAKTPGRWLAFRYGFEIQACFAGWSPKGRTRKNLHRWGKTSLTILAAMDGEHSEVARQLMKLGLDPHIRVANLHTQHGYGTGSERPLDWALRHGETRVAQVLAGDSGFLSTPVENSSFCRSKIPQPS